MKRQKLILAALLCLFVIAAAAAWVRMPAQQRVKQLRNTPGSTVFLNMSSSRQQRIVELRIDLMEQKEESVKVIKDIFRTVDSSSSAASAAAAKMKAAPAIPVPPPSPHDIARQQLLAYRPIGIYRRNSVRIAFLAKGNEIAGVRVGEMLLPGYRVVAITDDQIQLCSDEGGQKLTMQF